MRLNLFSYLYLWDYSDGMLMADNGLLLMYFIGVVIGSLFPDIDEPGSYIGRKLFMFSLILSQFIDHRGITHTITICIAYAGILYSTYLMSWLDTNMILLSIGFLVGNIGHIFGDMMTKGGVAILYPLSKKRIGLFPRPMRFYTSGVIERIVIFPLFFLLSAFVIYQNFGKVFYF